MARPKSEPKEQFNVMLSKRLMWRVRWYGNNNHLQPSNTQIAVSALTKFLDGEGVPQDKKEADELLKKKAKHP